MSEIMTGGGLTPEQAAKVFVASGSINPELAQDTVDSIGLKLGETNLEQFPDGEFHPRYKESVRGKHVFVMQSHGRRNGLSVNDAIVEQELMIDAALRASASQITAVNPYFAYMRGDKKQEGREPIPSAYMIGKLQNAGANRIVAVDLHSGQSQGHFHGPFDPLLAHPVIISALRDVMEPGQEENYLMVSPDEGRLRVATIQAEELGIDVAFIPKKRKSGDSVTRTKTNLEEADGRDCFLVDDIIATGGTVISAVEMLKKAGAKDVYVAATHGTLPGNALENLSQSEVKQFIMTDTLPMHEAKEALGDRLKVVSMAPLIGQAIVEIVSDGSVSKLFGGLNNSY
ncbi:MAG TPA: ribose-phosphate pyrophosphokinase [Candidatus Saccharimonadales bacterium]|nr:ribose-phosphate pyrophosphokinase [Candidatus Saccharimonadales bacterium]